MIKRDRISNILVDVVIVFPARTISPSKTVLSGLDDSDHRQALFFLMVAKLSSQDLDQISRVVRPVRMMGDVIGYASSDFGPGLLNDSRYAFANEWM